MGIKRFTNPKDLPGGTILIGDFLNAPVNNPNVRKGDPSSQTEVGDLLGIRGGAKLRGIIGQIVEVLKTGLDLAFSLFPESNIEDVPEPEGSEKEVIQANNAMTKEALKSQVFGLRLDKDAGGFIKGDSLNIFTDEELKIDSTRKVIE